MKAQAKPVELDQAVQMVEFFADAGMAKDPLFRTLVIAARAGLDYELQQQRFSRKACRSLLARLNAAEAHTNSIH
ncbi:hypothetical protein ACT3R7_12580 [Halomonas sp. AOP43-A1-21]|uniref:hypothetical protein n=1 Tax=Halomonas TaxID=2745 RepID=UPI001868E71B|nr:hypothetical protein [Halomonas colorata]